MSDEPTDATADQPDTAQPDTATQDAAKIRKRRMGIAGLALVLGAVCLWAASRMTWAKLTAYDHLQVKTFKATGSDWSPWLIAVPIVLVAALAAMVALKGWALRVAAVVVAVLCVLAVIPTISTLTGGNNVNYATKAADVPGLFIVESISTPKWPAVLVVVGAIFGVFGAVQMMRLAVGATGLSSKYQTPAARRAELEREIFDKKTSGSASGGSSAGDSSSGGSSTDKAAPADPSDRLLWDALDSGEDPTDSK
ncbi:Trp biosynthesis-associated membrane protein [Jongsikchunia kroppenstedtii]|uniref:Trp biosynthesis-associated membrane protein n=1 Tax=Jongsikchunia kroppenstedtii TaxID=1121721 RepID=UPI000366A6C6|nr:Trp biosynthesis-associated membrane protein [Jongsikchunia kroppenstedtii]